MNLSERPDFVAALFKGLQDGVVVLDHDNVHVYVNDAFCRMTGFSEADLIGSRPPFPYWPPEELSAIIGAFQRTVVGGEVSSFELVFAGKDGRRIPVIVSPSSIRGEDGSVAGRVATVKDITERKQLERDLAASEQRWRSIAENPFDFVVIIDRAYRYTYVNHVAPGITLESLLGKQTPFDFSSPADHAAMREAFETTFETGRATSYDTYSPQLDGWYSSIVGPIREQGTVTSLSILTREITQQKRAEEQVREAHKLETIGTLAGGIAHDLNNILTPILAHSDLAQLSLRADHEVQLQLRAIHEAALRARDLVRRILQFSRRQEPHKEVLDLAPRVREGVKLLVATAPATIDLTVELPEAPVWVLADGGRVDQVVVNLVANALQAMTGAGGKLVVRLQAATREAVLVVADTGPGMDADTQRRAFDPFFTTRPGAGTGLGLAIVQRVVGEHGGRVSVISAPGQGATFSVRLPLVAAPGAQAASGGVDPAAVEAGRLRVLCVDDEPAVLNVARSALERGGHAVRALSDPQEALAAFCAEPEAFDVLLTDQTMPNLRGTSLVRLVRARRPDLPCVVMTGFADEATVGNVRALGLGDVLAKPFSAAGVVAAIERAARRLPDEPA